MKLNKLIFIKYALMIVIVIGIFLRFVNLDQKVYNWDEVRSFYRLSGYVENEVIEEVYTGDIISVSDLKKYQMPNQKKTLLDAFKAFSKSSEHPPLYYLLARFCQGIFGSPYSAKVLSVLLSIMVFPLLYYLCYELFELELAGWIAMALFAVSPYHILLSQAARQYSLWTLLILLSNWLLLIALKTEKKIHWLTYTIALIAGLYTHLLFTIVAFSQFIYVAFIKFVDSRKIPLKLFSYFGIAIIAFSPWIFVIKSNLNEVETKTDWATKRQSSLSQIFWGNVDNIGDVFYDINTNSNLEKIIAIMMTIVILYSLYYVCRNQPIKTSSLVILLIFPPLLFLLLPDLILLEGVRSIQSRYVVPTYTGILLSLAYLIAAKINQKNNFVVFITTAALSLLLLLGIRSGVAISQSPDWDYLELKGTPISQNLEMASIINQSKEPLIISTSFNNKYILSLSHLLKDQVKFQLYNQYDNKAFQEKLDILSEKNKFSDIYLYFLSPVHVNYITHKYPSLTLEEVKRNLLKITN